MKFFEDDMDDLFNKAGRQYPLKTDPKDWESVRAALYGEEPAAPAVSPVKKYRRLLPLLLLLLIPAVYVFLDKENVKVNDGRNNENIFSDNEVTLTPPANTNTRKTALKESRSKETNSGKQTISAPGNETTSVQQTIRSKETTSPKQTPSPKKEISVYKNSFSDKSYKSSENNLNRTSKNNQINDPAAWTTIPSITGGYTFDQPFERISINNRISALAQPNGSPSVPKSDKQIKNRKGLYYGIIATPDVSTIKGQAVKGVGYSAGVIVGYNLNAHWAAEAGMLWSNKKYYTDGKFFDKKGPGIPDYVNVHWLDGGCNMFEFPVVVRYNFTTKRNTFYANAGLTSYMMRKEDYDYGASAGPSGNYYEGYRSYNRSGDHLFANVQLGAGYTFGISPKLNVRVEPYLKAPLKKIGIGKMPITSTGLYFAITRDLR